MRVAEIFEQLNLQYRPNNHLERSLTTVFLAILCMIASLSTAWLHDTPQQQSMIQKNKNMLAPPGIEPGLYRNRSSRGSRDGAGNAHSHNDTCCHYTTAPCMEPSMKNTYMSLTIKVNLNFQDLIEILRVRLQPVFYVNVKCPIIG